MGSDFLTLLPETIFKAAEILGGRCTGRFLALHAMENRVYDIEFEDETHLVAKFYRPGRWDRTTIQAEHDFLKALQNAEIPVVAPLEDSKGKSLFEIDGLYYVLFPKRPGRLEPELNKQQLERVGRYLARIHNVGASFKKAPRLRLDPESYGRAPIKYLIENQLVPDSFRARYEQLAKQLCDLITPFFDGTEYLLLHGDCHSGNILWRADEPYFIDFDDMLYAPPVQDIWMLTGSDDSYGIEMRKILLESYQQIRSFDMDSLKLIEPLRALRMIHFTTWIAKRWTDNAFKIAFPAFGSERYWQEQMESLSVQIEKIVS